MHNQASGPYERKSLADIAKEVSHPRAPISPRMIKKINASIRAEVVAKGKTPKKYRLVDKSRPEAISKLRKMLAANINLGINEAAPGLGMSVERMQKVLPQFGEAFETEKRKARIVAINLLDVATDHKLTHKQLAKKLGLTGKYVLANWTRRGQASSANIRVNNLKKDVLSLLGGFTSPESGVLSVKQLVALTGEPKVVVFGALSRLRKSQLVIEAGIEGKREYCISSKGIKELNGRRETAVQSLERLREMSLAQLLDLKERLSDARYGAGVGIHSTILKYVDQRIAEKRKVLFKK